MKTNPKRISLASLKTRASAVGATVRRTGKTNLSEYWAVMINIDGKPTRSFFATLDQVDTCLTEREAAECEVQLGR